MTFTGEKAPQPRPKKSWSQNFLTDRNIIERIAAEVTRAAAGASVLELGAGTGALTQELAKQCSKVIALERDRELAPVLREKFGDTANVGIVEANALTFSAKDLLSPDMPEKICVAGNLPYHIASQIIFHLIDERAFISSFVLMLQKEMADRIVSGPGTKDYGILSIFCALHTRPRQLFNVPPGAFRPRPRVDSSVVRFDVLHSPAVEVADEKAFKRVVKAAFNQRRKTLKNALGSVVADASALDAAFVAAGIDPGRRGETLDLSEFARLASVLAACIKENGND